MHYGWHQIAFERDIGEQLTPIATKLPLIALRTRKGIRVFDAICPHRGAHLGFGGCADGNVIVCPFHGRRVGLGVECETGYRVKEYKTLTIGGMIFICLSEQHDHGFQTMMREIDLDHFFVAGFSMAARVPAELVVENGFDSTHFGPVHKIRNEPEFTLLPSRHGEFGIQGTFLLPSSPWHQSLQEHQLVAVPYMALAYSPGIVLSRMGGEHPYWVITTATPLTDKECTIRLSIAVPASADGTPPSEDGCAYLLRQSRAGLEKDLVIWENMRSDWPSHFAKEDVGVIEFRKYLQHMSGSACE